METLRTNAFTDTCHLFWSRKAEHIGILILEFKPFSLPVNLWVYYRL